VVKREHAAAVDACGLRVEGHGDGHGWHAALASHLRARSAARQEQQLHSIQSRQTGCSSREVGRRDEYSSSLLVVLTPPLLLLPLLLLLLLLLLL
jgi:hypothetical protein